MLTQKELVIYFFDYDIIVKFFHALQITRIGASKPPISSYFKPRVTGINMYL